MCKKTCTCLLVRTLFQREHSSAQICQHGPGPQWWFSPSSFSCPRCARLSEIFFLLLDFFSFCPGSSRLSRRVIRVFICVCVCVSVCVSVCVCERERARERERECVCVLWFMYLCVCECVCEERESVYSCNYACVCVCVYVCVSVCCMHVWTYVRMCLCMRTQTHGYVRTYRQQTTLSSRSREWVCLGREGESLVVYWAASGKRSCDERRLSSVCRQCD